MAQYEMNEEMIGTIWTPKKNSPFYNPDAKVLYEVIYARRLISRYPDDYRYLFVLKHRETNEIISTGYLGFHSSPWRQVKNKKTTRKFPRLPPAQYTTPKEGSIIEILKDNWIGLKGHTYLFYLQDDYIKLFDMQEGRPEEHIIGIFHDAMELAALFPEQYPLPFKILHNA